MLAVKEAINRGYKNIDIYGAFGGRFDHMFSNIQALAFIAENNSVGNLISESETVTLLNPEIMNLNIKIIILYHCFLIPTR